MYDIKPLEEEWLKYQTHKRKPWYIFFIFLIITILTIVFLINKSHININLFEKYFNSFSREYNENTDLNKKKDNINLLNGALKRLEILNSHISVVDDTVKSQVTNSKTTDILVDIPILNQEGESIVDKGSSNAHRDKVHLDIIETTSISAYKDVEERFHQSHDIDDALFLAKSYYKKGNYKKAEQWAVETNKLDSTLEESFLIFIKSKMKLGERREVLSMLNQYLERHDSTNVRVLLNQIKNNEF